MSISYIKVGGEEIYDLLVKMQSILENEPKNSVFIACLALSLSLAKPDLAPEELVEGVKGLTEWIATYASEPEGGIN